MDVTAEPRLTFEEFVSWEQQQEFKREFAGGRVLSFAGGTLARSALAAELIHLILPAVRPCRTHESKRSSRRRAAFATPMSS